jgi:4-amino-4-deoxy-L-arabinose transferase-like glycosyltransferase
MKTDQPAVSILFSEPSLWKGPVIPFVMGLSYYLIPIPESVLILNIILFTITVIGLYIGCTYLGASSLSTSIAILLWIFYYPHAFVFGYYLAEPLITFFLTTVFLLIAVTLQQRRIYFVLPTGAVCGLLLLSRAPFILVVLGLVLILLYHFQQQRLKAMMLFLIGFGFIFFPWPLRNYIVYGEFIPFTTEGGKILFQGVWIPGDDQVMGYASTIAATQLEGSLRAMPEFQQIEAGEAGLSPIDSYRYWQKLAIREIKSDPLGQLRLCIRKAIRFWVRLPQHSWVPNWKTAVVAGITLPLAFIGCWRGRRSFLVQIFTVFVAGLWLFHALVHAELRYNFPVMPMMFVLAAIGVQYLLGCPPPLHPRTNGSFTRNVIAT